MSLRVRDLLPLDKPIGLGIGLIVFGLGLIVFAVAFRRALAVSSTSLNEGAYQVPMMVQPLLSRFPGPLKLYPSRLKFLTLFAGSASFVAIGAITLVKQDSSAMTWFCVLFFALCAVVFAARLLPGSASLTLDAEGFRLKQFYFVRKSRWQNVTNIDAGYVPPTRTKFVRYNDTERSGWRLARWETALLGYNAMLPDTYGMSADDLAALMIHWRDRVLALASTQGVSPLLARTGLGLR